MNKFGLLCLLAISLCFNDAFAQVNLSAGLVAYYPFNGSFNDASGNGNNGTGMNGVTFGTDQWGNANSAAFFDGIDDYVNIPGSLSLTAKKHFSLAFRYKTNNSRYQMILSKADYLPNVNAPDNVQYHLGVFGASAVGTQALYFATTHNGNCTRNSFNPSAIQYAFADTPSINQWYCVVMTFDSGLKKVYVNGVLKGQSTVTGHPINASPDTCVNGPLKLGVWWSGDPRWFTGWMDEVCIWNRTLNPQEIDSVCHLKANWVPVTINQYAAVTSRSTNCDNSLTVDDASGFKAGDTVLMIQMKGAAIDTSNTSTFGAVLSYNGAGNYEQNLIKSISGNKITLLYKIKRNYDIPGGLVQLVRIPFYNNYTISQPHTCKAWNGVKGGVFAINVSGTLTLNEDIDVSGMGFRGGISNLYYRATNICNVTDFYHPPNLDTSAQKGEGVTTVGIGKTYGRGSMANGGGGGNAHNSGGGGGGNGGAGGIGGMQYAGCAGNPTTNIIAGLGGLSQTYNATLNKAFMGGGGGAGHANEQVNSNGGTGGGIIYVNAGSLAGSGHVIKSDGAAAPECSAPTAQCNDDGTGGGGAGGTLLLSANSISPSINLLARGGKGANVYLISTYVANGYYHGPGGGGGGGTIWVSPSLSSSLTGADVAGGANGVLPQASNNPYGTAPGNGGQKLSTLQFITPVDTFKPGVITANFSYTIVSCNTAQFTATGSGISGYLWNFGSSTSNQQNPTYTFPGSGTYNVTLTITDSNGCTSNITKPVVVAPYTGSRYDTGICAGNTVTLSAYAGAVSYTWAPPTGLSSTTTATTVASPSATTTYIVTVNAGSGCIFRDTFLVKVAPAAKADFSFSPQPPVPNTPIQFQNMSANASVYAWTFGDGAGSSELNPTHMYRQSGSFKVCLIASNSAGCSDSVCKTVEADIKIAIGVPSAFSPNGDLTNDIVFVHGSGVESFTLKIYNRWGQKVFETSDMKKGWDGTYNGQIQDAEVFAYILTATFIDGSSTTQKGNISLIR
jgi:gliding motility-associated-like protein